MNYVLPIAQFVSVVVVIGVIGIILFYDGSGRDGGGY